ncbi:hypothetical protein HMPREF1868_00364 [Olsenella sp. DNF00959]|nr:hypothetical protein HMPREF1868_00364 [Olsenella sp. DNF00959]
MPTFGEQHIKILFGPVAPWVVDICAMPAHGLTSCFGRVALIVHVRSPPSPAPPTTQGGGEPTPAFRRA